jgi:diguanylate cyclase (GGDEF)-like protein
MGITELLSRQSRSVVLLLGLASLFGIAIADYLSSLPLMEFPVLYIIPISFFTWFAGRRWAMLVAIGSSAWILATNLRSYGISAVAYWNALILLGLYVGCVMILGELRSLYLRERDLSRLDALTQLPNRRAFFEFCEIEASRARRYRHPLTLVFLDVDEFKQINDRFGHMSGDQVLRRTGLVIQSCLRKTDLASRMGGDEFAILLPETNQQGALPILERLQAELRSAIPGEERQVTFSIGAVTFGTPPENVDEMIRIADQEMYRAKHEGKNRMRQKDLA